MGDGDTPGGRIAPASPSNPPVAAALDPRSSPAADSGVVPTACMGRINPHSMRPIDSICDSR